MISTASSSQASSSAADTVGAMPETRLASGEAGANAAWSIQSFAFTYGDGTASHISVIGGPSDKDPLAGLDGLRVPGGMPGEDIIHAGGRPLEGGPGDEMLHASPGPDIFIYHLGGGNDTIHGFDPSADRLVILGSSSVSLGSDPSGATVLLPDGATITLHLADSEAVHTELAPPFVATHGCIFF